MFITLSGTRSGVTMPLSEYEQRVLEQMERHLSSDDPQLAQRLASKGRRSGTRYTIAIIGSAVGLLLLVLGAYLSQAWVGVVGFVTMFAAVAFAFARPGRPAATGGATRARTRKPSLMSRLEERWEQRRQGGR